MVFTEALKYPATTEAYPTKLFTSYVHATALCSNIKLWTSLTFCWRPATPWHPCPFRKAVHWATLGEKEKSCLLAYQLPTWFTKHLHSYSFRYRAGGWKERDCRATSDQVKLTTNLQHWTVKKFTSLTSNTKHIPDAPLMRNFHMCSQGKKNLRDYTPAFWLPEVISDASGSSPSSSNKPSPPKATEKVTSLTHHFSSSEMLRMGMNTVKCKAPPYLKHHE